MEKEKEVLGLIEKLENQLTEAKKELDRLKPNSAGWALEHPLFRKLIAKVAEHDRDAAVWLLFEARGHESFREDSLDSTGIDLDDLLPNWDNTPQGHSFWSDLDSKIGEVSI